MILDKKEMRFLINKIDTLPTLPHVVSKLGKILENPMVSAEEVNRIISSDQVLTAKILKLVNSAFYGFPGQISTVTHAIVILGFTAVKSIALSASVFDMFPAQGQAFQFDRKKFWEHSIGTAVIAKVLARKMNYQEEEEAFVAGLLHDIGKVILDQYIHDLFLLILTNTQQWDTSFIEAEKQMMNFNHQDIGNWLGEKWSLPLELKESVAYHHTPDKANSGFILATICHLADIFARVKKIGNGGDNFVPQINPAAWKASTLTDDDILPLLDEIDEEIEKAEIFFTMIGNK